MSCAVHPRIYRHGPIALSRWSGRQWQQAVARDTLLLTVGETHHALLDQAAQIGSNIKNWSCQLNRMCCIETLAVHFCTWYPLICMIQDCAVIHDRMPFIVEWLEGSRVLQWALCLMIFDGYTDQLIHLACIAPSWWPLTLPEHFAAWSYCWISGKMPVNERTSGMY